MANVIQSLLHRPLFGTRAIPKEATVDPAIFTEDEFPVHCSKCGYELRGLADGRCPECGEAFERGKLLVRQYVQDVNGARWRRTRSERWVWRLGVLGTALFLLAGAGFECIRIWFPPGGASPPTKRQLDIGFVMAIVLFTMSLLGFASYFAALVLSLWPSTRKTREQRRAVLNALFED